jgi:hypothetical protein
MQVCLNEKELAKILNSSSKIKPKDQWAMQSKAKKEGKWVNKKHGQSFTFLLIML